MDKNLTLKQRNEEYQKGTAGTIKEADKVKIDCYENSPKKTMVQRLELLKGEILSRASDKTQKIDHLIREMKRTDAEDLIAAAESFLFEDIG